MNGETSRWVLISAAFGEILFSCALFLRVVWLRFGEFAPFAWGSATFFAVLQILIIVGLRFKNRTEVLRLV